LRPAIRRSVVTDAGDLGLRPLADAGDVVVRALAQLRRLGAEREWMSSICDFASAWA
jgi:hypothetical protein